MKCLQGTKDDKREIFCARKYNHHNPLIGAKKVQHHNLT